jgi:hypothetical protein
MWFTDIGTSVVEQRSLQRGARVLVSDFKQLGAELKVLQQQEAAQ